MNTATPDNKLQTVNRITRDISDGILLLDKHGTVLYINNNAGKLLGISSLKEGEKYAAFMEADVNGMNDAFHQYILDCIYERNISHKGAVKYVRPDGGIRYFSVNASFSPKGDGFNEDAVILSFSDSTQLHIIKTKHDDSIKVMVGLIGMIAIWNIVYALWNSTGQKLPSYLLTVIIEAIGILGAYLILRLTSITWADMGLGIKGIKKSLLFNITLTLAVIAVGIIAKYILIQLIPGGINPGRPFIDWKTIHAIDMLYIPTVVLQEFLTRGVVQGSLDRVLPDNYPPAVSIIVSSLFFGAVHLHKGLMYMVGAALLLSVFGIIYNKQKSIWALCIPHLCLSWMMRILFGVG